MRAFRLLTFP